jgi:hypothetical protein
MIVSIMQPAYLPWLGYFDRISKSDCHIVLDHVSMDKNSKTKFTNRNKMRTVQGWSWLTVPVKAVASSEDTPINKLEISSDVSWTSKHWKTLQASYSRASFFTDYSDFFESFYKKRENSLAFLLDESTEYLLTSLKIDTHCLRSSDLSPQSKKSDLILELCKKVGATCYLSGPFGRDYLDAHKFEDAGIELRFHDYVHPEYEQVYKGFEPYMSIVDLLFNHGPKSLEILST